MIYDLGNGRTVETPRTVEEAMDRAGMLRAGHERHHLEQARIRAIMDGGVEAVRALIGKVAPDLTDLPVGDFMGKALEALAAKLSSVPDLVIDPPRTGRKADEGESARRKAEKRARIVSAYDDCAGTDVMMPQLARWLPGYGYAAAVVVERRTPEGWRYPHVELRDPYETYPGAWGPGQQPREVAFIRTVPLRELARVYPEHAEKIKAPVRRGDGGGILLDAAISGKGSWEGADRDSAQVVEYMDEHGTWFLLPDRALLLDYIANPLSRAPFWLFKRFAFNRLRGQYDNVIGLMASMAKQNLLVEIAATDSVFAETNMIGGRPVGGTYKRGRFAVNEFDGNVRIERGGSQVPFQMMQQIDRLERQLRIGASYPVTDDGQSPNSFVTGRGLQELDASTGRLVEEYQTIIARGWRALDSLRLEWDESCYPTARKPLVGELRGSVFAEEYVPSKDIAKAYRTRRVYGAMATFDNPTKIVGGLQLLQGGIIDTQTMQEQMHGLGDVTKLQERIRAEKAEQGLMAMLTSGQPIADPRVPMVLIEMLPAGQMRTTMEKFFSPEGEQMSPEQQMAAAGMMGADPMMAEGPPDITTVLSRLEGNGSTAGGVQTVARI